MDHLEFPRFMCRVGTAWQLESGRFDVRTVASAEEAQAAQAEGWRFDQYEARDAGKSGVEVAAQALADHIDAKVLEQARASAMSRAELEAKAAELGITYHHKTGDKKLAELIAAKLAG